MPLLVAGMHRSGTSALMGAIAELGVNKGDFTPLGANDSQPLGHHESIEIVALNDELLRAVGGNWIGTPRNAHQALAGLASGPLGKRARELIKGGLEGRCWALKDPRFSVCLPFWRGVIDDFGLVVCSRHPLEVARSLEARDEIPVSLGLAVWQHYSHRLLSDSEGLDTHVVRFDTLISDPAATLAGLSTFVETHTGNECASRVEFGAKTIHRDAVRSVVSPKKLTKSTERIDAYFASRHGKQLGQPTSRVNDAAVATLEAGAYAGYQLYRRSALESELAGNQRKVAALQTEIESERAVSAQRQATIEERDAQAELFVQREAELRSDADAAISALRHEFDQRAGIHEAEIGDREERIRRLESEIEHEKGALRESQAEVRAGQEQIAMLEDELLGARSSLSSIEREVAQAEAALSVVQAQLRLALMEAASHREVASDFEQRLQQERASLQEVRSEVAAIKASRSYAAMRRYSEARRRLRVYTSLVTRLSGVKRR